MLIALRKGVGASFYSVFEFLLLRSGGGLEGLGGLGAAVLNENLGGEVMSKCIDAARAL